MSHNVRAKMGEVAVSECAVFRIDRGFKEAETHGPVMGMTAQAALQPASLNDIGGQAAIQEDFGEGPQCSLQRMSISDDRRQHLHSECDVGDRPPGQSGSGHEQYGDYKRGGRSYHHGG